MSAQSKPSCAGGWCEIRESCHHYRPGVPSVAIIERMCEPGQDGVLDGHFIQVLRPVGSWERIALPLSRLAAPFDALLQGVV